MPIPNVPKMFELFDASQTWLAAAQQNRDAQESAHQVAVAQVYATLALAHATWLKDPKG